MLRNPPGLKSVTGMGCRDGKGGGGGGRAEMRAGIWGGISGVDGGGGSRVGGQGLGAGIRGRDGG